MFVSTRFIDVVTNEVLAATEASAYVERVEDLTRLADEIVNGMVESARMKNSNSSSGVSSQSSNPTGRDFVENSLGLNMKMVWVEGGSFQMGGTSEQGSDVFDNEYPIRRVNLNGFFIGESVVTQEQWEKVMGTSIYQQASKAGYSVTSVGPDYPMYYVSWDEAQAFCRELSRITGRTYCLPTEAQWEYAARGGKNNEGTKYSGSWSLDAVGWYDDNSGSAPQRVKYKRPNSLGIYDMSGNVWEWCSDWYSNTYNVNDVNNPTGPSSGSNRVLRGGGWFDYARKCRVSYRGSNSPGSRTDAIGFRVVLIP